VSGRSGCRGPRRLQARNRPLAGSRPRASPRRPLQGFLALRAPRADRAARAGPSASPFARSPSSSRSAASPRSAISDCPDGPPPRFGEARGNEQRRLPMNRVLSGHQPVDALMNVLKREHVSYELILHRHTETAVAEAEAQAWIRPGWRRRSSCRHHPVSPASSSRPRTGSTSTRRGLRSTPRRSSSRPRRRSSGAYPEFELGAVPPLGGPQDRVLVDVRLFDLPTVVFEAGTHDESIRIRPSELLSAADAEPAELACDRPEELPETAHHDRGVREG
jgi:hypothetical protein